MLSFLARLFGAAVAVRNKAYDRSWLPITDLPVPVISAGGISAGGSGKTPLADLLLSLLQDLGHRPGLLSRGYGRKQRKDLIVTGAESRVSWRTAGDEPAMIYSRRICPMGIGADRVRTAQQLLRARAVDCLVLDDGFQHRKIGRQADVVILDAAHSPWDDRLLPWGRLREPTEALARAQAVIVNGPDPAERAVVLQKIRQEFPQVTCFQASLQIKEWRIWPGPGVIPLSEIRKAPVAAFAGIANPQRFLRFLRMHGLNVQKTRWFKDHARFEESVILETIKDFQAQQCRFAVTTAKDAVRLEGVRIPVASLVVADVELNIIEKEEFIAWLLKRLWPN